MRKAIIACLAFAFSLAVYALPAVAEDQKKDPPKQPACTSNVCQKYKEDKKGIVQNITGKTTTTKPTTTKPPSGGSSQPKGRK
jgi:hypothetical protein